MSWKPWMRGCAIVALLLLCMTVTRGLANPDGLSTAPFCGGEVLRYRVRYGPLHLADLVITQDLADSAGGRKAVLRMTGESTSHLPGMKLKWSNRAVLLPAYPCMRDFEYVSALEDQTRLTCRYDADGRQAVIEETSVDAAPQRILRPMDGPVYDAGGIFMMIRAMSGSGRKAGFSTLVVDEFRPTLLEFTPCVEDVEVPAFPGKARGVRVNGKAEWNLPTAAGMTGAFHVWVTEDEAAIPLKATVKIFLGSVTVELMSYERPSSDTAP
jgi:hypothetical protein